MAHLAALDPDGNITLIDTANGQQRGPPLVTSGAYLSALGFDPTVPGWQADREWGPDRLAVRRPGCRRSGPGVTWDRCSRSPSRPPAERSPALAKTGWSRSIVQDEEWTLRLSGHTDGVQALAYGPDGRTLYSGGVDRTIRVWDAEAGRWSGCCRGTRATFPGCRSMPAGSTARPTTARFDDGTRGCRAGSSSRLARSPTRLMSARAVVGSPWGAVTAPLGCFHCSLLENRNASGKLGRRSDPVSPFSTAGNRLAIAGGAVSNEGLDPDDRLPSDGARAAGDGIQLWGIDERSWAGRPRCNPPDSSCPLGASPSISRDSA